MPNHVINELVFHADAERQSAIREALCDSEGRVDFQVLVPLPKNMWWGSVSLRHEEAFKRTALDWAVENWGTKWNAYSHRETEATESSITFRFVTAWRPPYPWLAAIFNTLKISFDHNWLSEGGGLGSHGTFDWSEAETGLLGDAWKEEKIADENDTLHRHLRHLLWGDTEDNTEDE